MPRRRSVISARERLLVLAYDKDLLGLRGGLAALLQFLGLAGVLVTLRLVAFAPTVRVTNDMPIACIDSSRFQTDYSNAFRPFEPSVGKEAPSVLLDALKSSPPKGSIRISSFQLPAGKATRVPIGNEIPGRFVLCWFQPPAVVTESHQSCARRKLVAEKKSSSASMPRSVLEALDQRRKSALSIVDNASASILPDACMDPAVDINNLSRLGENLSVRELLGEPVDSSWSTITLLSSTLGRVVDHVMNASVGDQERIAALDAMGERSVLNVVVAENREEVALHDVTLTIDSDRVATILGGSINLEQHGERLESRELRLAPGQVRWALIRTSRYAIPAKAIHVYVGDGRYVPVFMLATTFLLAMVLFAGFVTLNVVVRRPRDRWLIGPAGPRLRRLLARRRAIGV